MKIAVKAAEQRTQNTVQVIHIMKCKFSKLFNCKAIMPSFLSGFCAGTERNRNGQLNVEKVAHAEKKLYYRVPKTNRVHVRE
jgi:hypothetical protein